MQKIVCSYTEELIPVAVQMCLELVQTFSQVLEGRYVYFYLVSEQVSESNFHKLFVECG